MLGVPELEICPAVGEEKPHPELEPGELVKELALRKAEEIQRRFPEALIIGADTVVALEGKVLGKPKSPADARRMLSELSGRQHSVFTGVAVLRQNLCLTHAERTEVFFRPLEAQEIARYVDTGEPLDKAGAYGAQGLGSLFVERIEGDFFNVMGLPLCALGKLLRQAGVRLL